MPFCQGVVVQAIERALSAPRLASYANLMATNQGREAVGAYIWGLELNSALSPFLGLVEVALRNSINSAACSAFGRADWMQDVIKWHGDKLFMAKAQSDQQTSQTYYRRGCHPFHRQRLNGRPLKHWKSHVERKRESILQQLTREGKPHSNDQVVAHAMFGFWLDFMEAPFEEQGAPYSLWPRCERDIFPNDASLDRAGAETILVAVKGLRNRVSHHEPAWNIARPLTPAGVNVYMRTVTQDMTRLLDAIDPNLALMMRNAGMYRRLDWLLDPQTVSSFSSISPNAPIDFKRLNRSIRRFAKQISHPTPLPNTFSASYRVEHCGRPLMTFSAFV